jgi:transcriptional regulator with XRE-family HTH domain
MDGPEMSEALRQIGWTAQQLAERLGVRRDTVTGWLTGRRPVPENLAAWLRAIRDHLDAQPLPDGWRSGGE